VPVVAGAGSNSTKEAVELSKHAEKAGADAVLIVTPYYNKPTQEGLYRHFKAIVEAVDLPMIMYNVPGRTVADMSNDTTLRLAELPNVIGLKDATGNIERGSDLLKRAPEGFAVYSGDDATALALTLLGGQGTISVTANVAPRLMHEMCAAALAGDRARAELIDQKLVRLHQVLFIEPNPIPTKWALHAMNRIGTGIRLPLVPLDPSHQAAVREALQVAGAL